MATQSYAYIRARLEEMPIVSSHEHHREDQFQQGLDLETLLRNSYVGWLGMPDPLTPQMRADYLERVRYNSYYVWLEKSLRLVYGVERVTASNWDEVSARISRAHRDDPGWHLRLLKSHARYERWVEDAYWDAGSDLNHPEMISPALRINSLLYGWHPEARDHNGKNGRSYLGADPGSLAEYMEAIERFIEKRRAGGVVALKSAIAYDRDLSFGDPSYVEAAKAWGKHPDDCSPGAMKAFQDYVMNRICEIGARLDLPFQHHTGLAIIAGSQPMKMEPLIARHPRTRFVLFHGGFPWVHEIAGLAHNYANVYPDMNWLPLISTSAAVQALHWYIETADSSAKIAWGGDSWTSEEHVGASLAWKYVVARTLGEKVDDGYFDMEDALRLAERLLHRNARGIYGL